MSTGRVRRPFLQVQPDTGEVFPLRVAAFDAFGFLISVKHACLFHLLLKFLRSFWSPVAKQALSVEQICWQDGVLFHSPVLTLGFSHSMDPGLNRKRSQSRCRFTFLCGKDFESVITEMLLGY